MSDRDPARSKAGALMSGEKLRTKPVELPSAAPRDEQTTRLLRELVAHLHDQRAQLPEEWLRRITAARLLTAMSRDEIYAEATSIFDQYVEALEAGACEALQIYAQNLSERIIPRGVETHEIVGIVLLLRDVLARALALGLSLNGIATALDLEEGLIHLDGRTGSRPGELDRGRQRAGNARALCEQPERRWQVLRGSQERGHRAAPSDASAVRAHGGERG